MSGVQERYKNELSTESISSIVGKLLPYAEIDGKRQDLYDESCNRLVQHYSVDARPPTT